MNKCDICPRNCKVDREKSAGFCGSNNNLKVAKVMLHQWEEPILANKYSGAIFFSNCPLKCVYCQNYLISQEGRGREISIDELVQIFKKLEQMGAENIDLVSPTQYANQIIDALKKYKPKVPVIWNSNGYELEHTLDQLKGLVDIFLPDFKYSSNSLAMEYSKSNNYYEIACKAIKKMRELCPEDIYKDGKLIKGLIIRHLVLPNHYLNSKMVLKWIKENLGNKTIISVMSQFVPYYLSKNYRKLSRGLTSREYSRIKQLVIELGFENGFLQDLESSCEKYIPNFEEDYC